MKRKFKNITKRNKDCWIALSQAVIIQAVDDYRKLLTLSEGSSLKGGVTLESVERFFKSEYFKLFTRVDGNYILYKLRKEQRK